MLLTFHVIVKTFGLLFCGHSLVILCTLNVLLTSIAIAFITYYVKQAFKCILEGNYLLYVGIAACQLNQQ